MRHLSQQFHDELLGTGLDQLTFMLLRVAEHGFITEAEDGIKKGADVNGFNVRTGKTALVLASENGHTDMARLLIRSGACVEGKYSSLSPLAFAAVNGHIEIVALVIEHGANVNERDTDLFFEKSVLNIASEMGYNDMVKLLLKSGANVNDALFESSLMYAVRNGHRDVAETLIDAGANMDYECPKGFSVLETSLMCGQQDIAKLLIERGAKLDGALMQAITCQFTDIVDILIDKDVKHKDKYGKTMLMIAAMCAETELMTSLIEKGSDIDEKDNKGMTALMYASETGCTGVVTLLIDNGADLNMKTMNGDTALILATTNEHAKTVEVLIDKGADVHIVGKDGMSTRQIAMINIPDKELLNIFIQKRFLVSKNNIKGQISINKPTKTPGRDVKTSVQDTNTSGQDTNTPGQDTNTSGQETHTSGQATNTSVKDTNTPGNDRNTSEQETNTSGEDMNTSEQYTNTSVQDTNTSEQDTITLGQDTSTSGKDTNTSEQETITLEQKTNTSEQEMNTSGEDMNTSGQYTTTSVQDTNTSEQDIHTSGQDTNTSGQDTITSGQNTNTSVKDTNTSGKNTNTSGQETNTSREDTNTSGQDTNTSEQDKITLGQDTSTSGKDTNTSEQETNTSEQETNTSEQEMNTSGEDMNTPGQDSNICQENIHINQSVDSDVKKVHSLSIDIQQQTKVDGNKKNDLSEGTFGNHESTDPTIKEQEEMSLCDTHLKHPVPSRKRRRTKQKRCQALNMEAPCPEVAVCHGSKVSSSKVASIHGSNVSSDLSKREDKRQAAESQTLLIQSAGPCTDSYDTVSTDPTTTVLEDKTVPECTDIAGAVSKAITANINTTSTSLSQLRLNTAEMVLEEAITNFKPERGKYFTTDDTASSIQNDDEWPECTFSDMDKILLLLADFLSDCKQGSVNTGQWQEATKKYLPQQNHIVFNLYYIGHVDHAHLQNPKCVNITDVTYCVIDEKT